MANIKTSKIAILATDGFEQSELFEPKRQLEDAGAQIVIPSIKDSEIKSWDQTDWGETILLTGKSLMHWLKSLTRL